MGFNIKLKPIIKSTVNTSPLENKVKNPDRSQTLKLINYIVIQSLKSESKTQKRTYTCEEARGENALHVPIRSLLLIDAFHIYCMIASFLDSFCVYLSPI